MTLSRGGYLLNSPWRLRHFFVVFLAGPLGVIVVQVVLAIAGVTLDPTHPSTMFGVVVPAQTIASLLAIGYLSVTRGTGSWTRDFGLCLRLRESWGLVGGLGLQACALILIAGLLSLLPEAPKPDQDVVGAVQAARSLEVSLAFIGTVILAPFVEEILYRGILLSVLFRMMNRHAAILISAAGFATAHLFDVDVLPLLAGLFLVGVGLGYGALRSKSLSLPIFLHVGVNLTGFLLARYSGHLG